MNRLVFAIIVALGLGLAVPVASAEAPMRQPEVLHERPSGFWTSNRPAKGGAYRWRLLGLGTALVLGTGLLTWRHVRKTNRARGSLNR